MGEGYTSGKLPALSYGQPVCEEHLDPPVCACTPVMGMLSSQSLHTKMRARMTLKVTNFSISLP